MANSHDIFFGDVTVRGKLRSDDLETADIRLNALGVSEFSAQSAVIGALSCGEAHAENLPENDFSADGVRVIIGKEVEGAAGEQTLVLVGCRGQLSAGTGEIHVYASPALTVSGVTKDNWQKVFRDGCAEWKEDFLYAVKRTSGQLTVSGRWGKISAETSYTQIVEFPCAFASASYYAAATPCVEQSPESAEYRVWAFPENAGSLRVTVTAPQNSRTGLYDFIATGRWK